MHRSGAVTHRLAGRLPRPDHQSVPAVARPWRRRRLDDRPLDPRSDRDSSDRQHSGRDAGLAWLPLRPGNPPPGKSPPARTTPVLGPHHRRDAWTDMPDWPVTGPEHALHLQPGGRLGAAAAPVGSRAATFRYDPADPTPTIGGRLLSRQGGYRDDTELSGRTDVLTFTSAPLETELTVYGNPVVEVDHSSDNPHFDVFVRVSEVDAVGRSRNAVATGSDASVPSPPHRSDLRSTRSPTGSVPAAEYGSHRGRPASAIRLQPRHRRTRPHRTPDGRPPTPCAGAASRLILPVADRSVT